jgi:hypothetical protein
MIVVGDQRLDRCPILVDISLKAGARDRERAIFHGDLS